MALRIEFSAAPVIRHVFARSRGRHSLYPDARARAAAAGNLPTFACGTASAASSGA